MHQYPKDIALCASLGPGIYRLGVERGARSLRGGAGSQIVSGWSGEPDRLGVERGARSSRGGAGSQIAYVAGVPAALHESSAEDVPLRRCIHWIAFDSSEWALGYRMYFGLISVDRATRERGVKPSARSLGEITRMDSLVI